MNLFHYILDNLPMLTTTNKLTQKFASGSLALGVATLATLAGSMVVTPSASAATLCYNGPTSALIGLTITCDDKVFSNFDIDPIFFTDNFGEATSTIIENNMFAGGPGGVLGNYIFNLDLNAGILNAGPASSAMLMYDVTVKDPTKYVFKSVSLDTDVDETANNISVEKAVTILAGGGKDVTLVSVNGEGVGPDMGIMGATKIKVKDTVNFGTNSELLEITNVLVQKPIPEPSAVLSLIALGGLGLVSLKRKQK